MSESDRPNRERLAEIGELAAGIAEESFPNAAVDPVSIINRKGITLSYGSYGGAFDGMIEHRSGRFHIYCNTARARNHARVRFTLSHELGHYFIDDHRHALEAGLRPHPSLSDYQSNNPAEQEADHFASNLLMPRERFLRRAYALRTGLPAILGLAKYFQTSLQSTAIRYTTLNAAPIVIIKWNPNGFDWKWCSGDAYAARIRKTIEVAQAVLPDSPTGRLLAGEVPTDEGFFESGTTAAAWFPFIGHGARRNDILIEQAISLGEHGALTVLYPQSGKYIGTPPPQ